MQTLYVESENFASEARALFQPIARRDADLARRLKRASDELVEHVHEGMCTVGRERRREYAAALKSALEAIACIDAAVNVGYLRDGDLGVGERGKALLERLGDVHKAA